MPKPRTPVESSSIASIGYDPRRRNLDVEFHTGGLYRYRKVRPSVAAAFLCAESKGRYFMSYIRDHFEFRRLPQRTS